MTRQTEKPAPDRRMGGWVGVTFEEIEVGKTFPAQDLPIGPEDLTDFYACLGENRGRPAAGDRIPAFLLNELRALKRQMRLPPGVLHAQEEITMSSAARLGDVLHTIVRIADKYIRNDKRFVVVEQSVRCTADQRPIMQIRHILYWPC